MAIAVVGWPFTIGAFLGLGQDRRQSRVLHSTLYVHSLGNVHVQRSCGMRAAGQNSDDLPESVAVIPKTFVKIVCRTCALASKFYATKKLPNSLARPKNCPSGVSFPAAPIKLVTPRRRCKCYLTLLCPLTTKVSDVGGICLEAAWVLGCLAVR